MQTTRMFLTIALFVMFFHSVISATHSDAAVRHYTCGNGMEYTSCENSGGYTCNDNAVVSTIGQCAGHGGVKYKDIPMCGDGVGDQGEQCDKGSQNSDTLPNGCRTDCRSAYCGDGVLDYGEECDSGQSSYYPLSHYNANTDPNSCRDGCKLPVCGDGIRDNGTYIGDYVTNKSNVFNEECDDGNNNDLDGCKSDCTVCLQLSSNINMTADTTLCRQVFNVDDYGPEGVIIIQHPGVTLDCDGATLQGAGGNAGIYVMQASNVTVKNCTVTGYDVGIKVVDSQNVKFSGMGNNMSGNTKPIELENSQLALPQAQSSAQIGGMGVQGLKKIDAQPDQNGDKSQTGKKVPGLVKPGIKKPGLVKPQTGSSGGALIAPAKLSQPGSPTTKGRAPTTKSRTLAPAPTIKRSAGDTDNEEEEDPPPKTVAPVKPTLLKPIQPLSK